MKLMEPRAKTKLKRNYVMLKKRNPRLYNHIFVCALNFYFNFKSRTCQCHNHFSLVVIFSYIRISHFKLLKQTLYGYTTASILPPPPLYTAHNVVIKSSSSIIKNSAIKYTTCLSSKAYPQVRLHETAQMSVQFLC